MIDGKRQTLVSKSIVASLLISISVPLLVEPGVEASSAAHNAGKQKFDLKASKTETGATTS